MQELKTNQFTQNALVVRWFSPLERQTITAYNLLMIMLGARNAIYPTRQDLTQATSHAYGLQMGYGFFAYGLQAVIEFRMTWIREDFIQKESYNQEVKTLLDAFLHAPLFEEKHLEEAKYLLKTRLEALKQDPDSLALQQAMAAAGEGKPFGFKMQGYLEDFEAISLQTIQDLYQSLMSSPHVTLFRGSLTPTLKPLLQKLGKDQFPEGKWELLRASSTPKEVILEKEISQSSLVQVYETGIAPNDKNNAALSVFSGLLGNSSVSLLFEIIREKHSLCYAISSSIIRFDGALLISTATRRQFIDQVKGLIQEILEDIKNQRVDPQIFETVKKELCDNILQREDALLGPINRLFLNDYLHQSQTPLQEIESIKAVSLEDIANIAKNLRLAASAELLQKEDLALEPMDIDMDEMDELSEKELIEKK